jgi:putative lipoprotein
MLTPRLEPRCATRRLDLRPVGPSTLRGVVAATIVALLLTPFSASAQEVDRDPWFGPDKALHFGVSAALAAGGYTVAGLRWDTAPPKLAFGAAVALSAGVLKELLDLAHYGTPSYRDLAWDAAGTLVGLSVSWLVDHFLFGPRPLFERAQGWPGRLHPGGRLSVTFQLP